MASDKKYMVSGDELTKAVCDYKEIRIKLRDMFESITRSILDLVGPKIKFKDTEEAIKDCVVVCFEKLDRFDPQKGKSFNYFTTIILSHLRQLYRCEKDQKEIREKLLAGKKRTLSKNDSGKSKR